MFETLFTLADVVATLPGLELLPVALDEILIAINGGDWGCGATSDLLFNGDDNAACNWINGLADMTA